MHYFSDQNACPSASSLSQVFRYHRLAQEPRMRAPFYAIITAHILTHQKIYSISTEHHFTYFHSPQRVSLCSKITTVALGLPLSSSPAVPLKSQECVPLVKQIITLHICLTRVCPFSRESSLYICLLPRTCGRAQNNRQCCREVIPCPRLLPSTSRA